MSYRDDINYKYVNNHDDGSNPPSLIGCAPFVVGIIVILILCLGARSCSKSFNDYDEGSQYEYSLLD